MILSKQQIEEIEKMLRNGSSFQRSYCINLNFSYLLETVKDLQARERKVRQLLKRTQPFLGTRFEGDREGESLLEQVKEHLK